MNQNKYLVDINILPSITPIIPETPLSDIVLQPSRFINTEESLVSANDNLDWFEKFKQLKQSNPTNLTCSYLNINSIRNKFDNLFDMIDQNIDIVCLAETKFDNSFPTNRF